MVKYKSVRLPRKRFFGVVHEDRLVSPHFECHRDGPALVIFETATGKVFEIPFNSIDMAEVDDEAAAESVPRTPRRRAAAPT